MTIKVKHEIPLSEFDCIPVGAELEVIESWNEYEGFIAVKYRGSSLYFNELYFEQSLVKIN